MVPGNELAFGTERLDRGGGDLYSDGAVNFEKPLCQDGGVRRPPSAKRKRGKKGMPGRGGLLGSAICEGGKNRVCEEGLKSERNLCNFG